MAESVGPVRLETIYRPMWTPDGWRESRASEDDVTANIIYENDEGAIMAFFYTRDPEASDIYLDHGNDADAQEIQIQGGTADLYIDSRENHSNVIVWTDEETGILFLIQGPLTSTELVKMAESVESSKRVMSRRYVYIPSWIPEGYKTVSKDFSERGQNILRYETEQGDLLTVIYTGDIDAGALYLEQGEAKRTAVSVSGLPADLYLDPQEGGANALVWQDGERLTWISGPLTEEELIRVAESMEPVKWPERLEEYRLGWIPGGYRPYRNSSVNTSGSRHTMYSNDEGSLIVLRYMRQAESSNLHILPVSGEGLETLTTQVNGEPADLYLEEGEANVLVWPDSEAGVLFVILAHCPEEELVKMAESVEVVPQEPCPTWLPKGYECFDESQGANGYIFYRNQENEQIDFLRYHYTDIADMSIHLSLDPGDVAKQVQVAGQTADLYLGQGDSPSFLVWIDEVNRMTYMLGGTLTEEEFIRIAESVRNEPVRPAPHRPAWVPEGYLLQGESNGGGSISLHYDAASGEQILYRYWLEGHDDKLEQELQEAVRGLTPESVQVNGLPARLYAGADGSNHLAWACGEPEDNYWISAPLSPEDLIWMAESVSATEQNES